MNWLNPSGATITTQQLLHAYATLDPNNNAACDAFFANFGPGNRYNPYLSHAILIDTPYERLFTYEHILHELEAADNTKYHIIHKGTPFYFMSWLAFTIQDYEKAVFYMDAAVGEDIRAAAGTTTPDSWQGAPGASFLLLYPTITVPPGRAITIALTNSLNTNITRLNHNTGSALTLDLFRDNFLIPNIGNAGFRSVISGLYVYMLEFDKRMADMKLGGTVGGSLKPFLIHLFTGGLIFESLLKASYGGATSTLGGYLGQARARTDLEISATPVYRRDQPPRPAGYTLPGVVALLPTWRSEDYREKIVAIAFALRNTAGHDLSWNVLFNEIVYQELYDSVCDAILWFIWKVHI